MTVDMRVRNGVVHTPGGAEEADILISAEKIVGLVSRAESVEAGEEIDAAGLHVLPGIVDLHAHTRVPGYEYKEDFLSASQAAAVGGVTTFTDMPNVDPPTDTVDLFEQKRELAKAACIVDWGHLVSPNRPDQIKAMAAAGATGFKIFQVSGGYPHDPRIAIGEPERILSAFQTIRETGLHCSVHPFNQPVMDLLTEQAIAAGKPHDARTFAEIYTADIVWRSGVAILLEMQKETGTRINLLHTHASGSLRLIKRAKEEGQRVTAAIDPKYYHLTKEDVKEQGSRCAPGGVVVHDEERMAVIKASLMDGTLDLIDSDHAPHTLEDLDRFDADPWTGPFGSPQYEYILSLMLTDVSAGFFTLPRLIQMMCENPARVIGRYPQKGAIKVGSDADLVLVDMDAEVIPSDEATYTKVRWTPYRGRRLLGKPTLTIRRGEVIARDGKVRAEPGSGRFLAGSPQD